MGKLRDWAFENGDPMPWRDVAVTVGAVMLPPVAGVMALGRPGAVAFVAALPAHLAARELGVPKAALVILTMGFAGFLSLGAPDMALVVAPMLGIMCGICGHYGFARPCVQALLTWTVFTSPIIEHDNVPVMFAVFVVAMGWSLWLTQVSGMSKSAEREDDESAPYAFVFGALLAGGLAISVWVGGQYFGPHGFWFPLTFVVLCMPPHGQLFSRTIKRTVGTVAGTAIALGIAWVSEAVWLTATVGILALPLGFRMLPANYTLFTTLLTVSVLEVLALVTDVDRLAYERVATMGAAAALTAVLAAAGAIALWWLEPGSLRAMQAGSSGDDEEDDGESGSDDAGEADAEENDDPEAENDGKDRDRAAQ